MQLPDEELARRAAGGDTAAFGQLVESYQRFVYNLCLRAMRDPEVAAEMAQETFLRAWRSIGGFRGDARFSTWLYTIAHNLCMNRLSSLERDARHRADDEDAEEGLERMAAREGDPARSYERKEQSVEVQRYVDRLPARYRTVIALFYLQELSYQEIAEVTGMPVGTVKTHLFRAKEMLRRAIDDGVPPGSVAADGVRGGDPGGAGGSPPGDAPGLLRVVPSRAG